MECFWPNIRIKQISAAFASSISLLGLARQNVFEFRARAGGIYSTIPSVCLMLDLLIWLAVTLRLVFHLLWIRLNNLLARYLYAEQREESCHHTITVIGDGFVEGVGDWVTCFKQAGIAARLQRLIQQNQNVCTLFNRFTCFLKGNFAVTSLSIEPLVKSLVLV